MGDADGLLCGWWWRGWGRGSWDAVPLSGSRGLFGQGSSVPLQQSEIRNFWDCASGHWRRGHNAGEALGYSSNGKTGGAGRDSEFTLYSSLQKPHRTEGWQTTQAAKSCFLDFSSPQPLILCRAVSVLQGRAVPWQAAVGGCLPCRVQGLRFISSMVFPIVTFCMD